MEKNPATHVSRMSTCQPNAFTIPLAEASILIALPARLVWSGGAGSFAHVTDMSEAVARPPPPSPGKDPYEDAPQPIGVPPGMLAPHWLGGGGLKNHPAYKKCRKKSICGENFIK